MNPCTLPPLPAQHCGGPGPRRLAAACLTVALRRQNRLLSEVAASMASSCLLLSSCSSKNLNCRGCKSGTRECNPRCEIPKTGGAIWVCSNNKTFAVGSEECFFTCGTQMVIATCISGDKWDVDLNTRQFQCPCGDPPSSAASLSCSSEPSPVDPTYPGGTVCRCYLCRLILAHVLHYTNYQTNLRG